MNWIVDQVREDDMVEIRDEFGYYVRVVDQQVSLIHKLVDRVHVQSVFAVFLGVQEYFGELHGSDHSFDLTGGSEARHHPVVVG